MKSETILKKLERLEEIIKDSYNKQQLLFQQLDETVGLQVLDKELLQNLEWGVKLVSSEIHIETYQLSKAWKVFIGNHTVHFNAVLSPGVTFRDATSGHVVLCIENLQSFHVCEKYLGKKTRFKIKDARETYDRAKKALANDEKALAYLEEIGDETN